LADTSDDLPENGGDEVMGGCHSPHRYPEVAVISFTVLMDLGTMETAVVVPSLLHRGSHITALLAVAFCWRGKGLTGPDKAVASAHNLYNTGLLKLKKTLRSAYNKEQT
jgi:hypothetical protein